MWISILHSSALQCVSVSTVCYSFVMFENKASIEPDVLCPISGLHPTDVQKALSINSDRSQVLLPKDSVR